MKAESWKKQAQKMSLSQEVAKSLTNIYISLLFSSEDNPQGTVVRNPINADPRLQINEGFHLGH